MRVCLVRGWWLASALMLVASRLAGSDAQWQEGLFSQRGLINAMATDGRSRIFAGGNFFTIDNSGNVFPGTRNLAEGDGERWWSVGGGVNGTVTALAVRGTDLFVAGTFTVAGSVAATNLARWDGTNWWPVGGGVNGTVNVLAVNGNDLYVGGYYTRAGDLVVSSIAKWDGATWFDIGGVFQGAERGFVWGMFVESNKVYVSGTFDRVGGVPAKRVAIWDGITWESLGLDTNALPNVALAFARHPSSGRLFAGGNEVFTEDSCPVFEWTGTRWMRTPLRSRGDNNGVRAMVCFGNDLYAGAGFFSFSPSFANLYDSIARFDGTNWSLPSTPFEYGGVSAMSVTSNRLYAAGRSGIPLSRSLSSVMHYDGKGWEIIGKGSPYQVQGGGSYSIRTLALHQGSMVAGGSLTGSGARDCVGAWNGRIWSSVGPRDGQFQCSEVFALLSRDQSLYAGTTGGLRIWNGSTWVAHQNFFNVRSIEVIGAEIYCGTTTGLWKWNGSMWEQLAFNGAVNALLFDGQVLYAGGKFDLVEGLPMRNVARWDGFAWEPLKAGVNGRVNCFAKRGNKLYVGGEFTMADDSAASYIALWDGDTWSAVGGGFSSGRSPDPTGVRALEFSSQGVLYAGGNFTIAGGQPANFIAAWNGVEWKALGVGVNSYVEDLLWDANKLVVCGWFTRAGQTYSSQIAVWHEAPALKWSHLPSSDKMTVSWPSAFSNYVLEANGDLPSGVWTALTNPIAISRGEWKATNSVSDPQKFFRLRRQ